MGGYTTARIGAPIFTIPLTPIIAATVPNKHIYNTKVEYFIFPFVILTKYSPEADVSPIAVVKQARNEANPKAILPAFPRSSCVTFTIISAC